MPVLQTDTDIIRSGNGPPATLRDDKKKTWICLECTSSFDHHHEIVKHMHSESHRVMINSSFTAATEIPQAEILNMLSASIV